MWAQDWGEIYDLVAPSGAGDVGYDLTELLVTTATMPDQDGETGEASTPRSGCRRSPRLLGALNFTKPTDREVVCHASAWDLDNIDDLRIKMCIKINATTS